MYVLLLYVRYKIHQASDGHVVTMIWGDIIKAHYQGGILKRSNGQ